jgi:hypothetical protein
VVEFNMTTGTASANPLQTGMTYYKAMTSPTSTCTCDSEAVIEMTFAPGMRSSSVITMTHNGKDNGYITFYLSDIAGDGFGKE